MPESQGRTFHRTGESLLLGVTDDVVGGTCRGFTSFGGPVCSNINYSRNGNEFNFPTGRIWIVPIEHGSWQRCCLG